MDHLSPSPGVLDQPPSLPVLMMLPPVQKPPSHTQQGPGSCGSPWWIRLFLVVLDLGFSLELNVFGAGTPFLPFLLIF